MEQLSNQIAPEKAAKVLEVVVTDPATEKVSTVAVAEVKVEEWDTVTEGALNKIIIFLQNHDYKKTVPAPGQSFFVYFYTSDINLE
jgi:hypothetical protein